MKIINHFVKEIDIDKKEDIFECWVQIRGFLKDLVRINLHPTLSLIYPPLLHVYFSTQNISIATSFLLQSSLPSVAMEGVSNDPNPQTQEIKYYKNKSKNSTSTVSQNVIVKTKPNTKPEGSVKVVSKGEGTREHLKTHIN